MSISSKELFNLNLPKGERVLDPSSCCIAVWNEIDLWGDEFLPEEFECPTCGNIGVVVPFTRPGFEGVEPDGFMVEYYAPTEEN